MLVAYKIVVDGNSMTVIDPLGQTKAEFAQGICLRFGRDRVEKISCRSPHTKNSKIGVTKI